ncbi:MAG: hypothetical protein R2707_16460 [Acidimicrobiales bacterium]
MDVIGILCLFFAGTGLGVYGALEWSRLNRPEREQALSQQVRALQTALEISRQAWTARAAMHEEADRIRRGEQGRIP